MRESLSVIGYTNHVNRPEVWAQKTENHQIDSDPVPRAYRPEILTKKLLNQKMPVILSITPVWLSNLTRYTGRTLYCKSLFCSKC